MNFNIFTSGCKANQWDSYVLAGILKRNGYSPGPLGKSGLVVVNACSLTDRAEADARRFIQRARRANQEAKIVLVGCHAQVYPDRHFGADLVLGQEEKFNIDRFLPMHGVFVRKGRDFHIERWLVDDLQKERTRFFLKIQDGCNKFCSYCVVPYARGAVRSRPSEEIIATMKLLVERGVKEVVLTGIDLAAYCDPLSGSDLKALLLLLENTEETPPRIRLSSVDPEYLDDEFIGILGDCGKLAKSLHIPVQSGSERILKSMGRRYSPSLINEIVGKLKDRIGRIGIGMDVMVGFPGEDEAAFAETYGFIEQLGVSYLHIFPFSEREGTKACAMEHKVPESIKRSRVRKLKAIDAKKRQAFSSLLIGSTVWVIPEARIYHNGHMRGYSDNYVPVYMPYEKSLENNLVEVTIKEMQGVKLIGGR